MAAIIGGLIALGRRPAVPRAPRTPRPPMPRPPAPRRPPPPPVRVPPKPPPPPPRVPPPPEPPTPSDAPPAPPEAPLAPPPPPPSETAAGTTETKPPTDAKPPEEPETDEPEDEEPEEPEGEEPENQEPEDEEPEDEAPAAAPAGPVVTSRPPSAADMAAGLNDLQERVQRIIEGRTIDGYYITNPDLMRQIWNEFPFLSRGRDLLTGYTGGTCGNAVKWGAEWLTEADVRGLFGPDAVYDTIEIENANRDTYNHTANRVTLPDGRRYVVDFWEGLVTGQAGPAIVPEAEWIARWTERCTIASYEAPTGGPRYTTPQATDPMVVNRGEALNTLAQSIEENSGNVEQGIRAYLAQARKARNPEAVRVAEWAVRTFRRDQF